MSYSYDNPNVFYSKGRLTAVSTLPGAFLLATDTSVTNYLGYDAPGRVTSRSQTTGGTTYAFSYGHNWADSLTGVTYPSGRVVQTSYDIANRVSHVGGTSCSSNTGAYASGFAYAPQNAPTLFMMGNQVSHAITYNRGLQPSGIQDVETLPLSGVTPLFTATLNWNPTSLNNGSPAASSNNNGNLWSAVYSNSGPGYSSPLTFTQAFA